MTDNKTISFGFYSEVIAYLNGTDTQTDIQNGAVIVIYAKENFYRLEVRYPQNTNQKQGKAPKFLKRFNCIRCGKKLTKEEHEIDTGNLCGDCRKATINEDERQ
jgi:hypothetical protein